MEGASSVFQSFGELFDGGLARDAHFSKRGRARVAERANAGFCRFVSTNELGALGDSTRVRRLPFLRTRLRLGAPVIDAAL